VKTEQKVHVLEEKARAVRRQWAPLEDSYPMEVVDLIIFHKLHLSMPLVGALKSFRNLKHAFVDWNEVRISTVREIQEALASSPESLAIAIFIKELLEFVHREQQSVSLEFLVEQNLGDIRRYLRQVRGLDSSTVNLILRLRKEHPVLPLTRSIEAVLDRLGLLTKSTRDKRERVLHEMVAPDKALAVHHFLLNHSQEFCPPDEEAVACGRCCMRQMCAFYAEGTSRSGRRASVRSSRPGRNGNGRSATA
jgi:endonuclease III